MSDARPHLVFVLTSPLAPARMLRGQCRFLREQGFRVTVVTGPGAALREFAAEEGVEWASVPMSREPAPLADAVSLFRLWRLLRRLRPDIVEAGTPKAGLLGMAAARLAGVGCRVYTLHGLRLETARGLLRAVLRFGERLAALAADRVLCVSPSLLDRAVELGLFPREKGAVAASGSANGVELARFEAARRRPPSSRTIGFVGRLTRDKGIAELYEAFCALSERFADLRLVLLGFFEEGDPLDGELRRALEADPRVAMPGFVDDPAPFYADIDIVALPSYREGLPGVVLEAGAAARPVVASRATGTVDAVIDGVTGLLVPPGDARALADALASLLADSDLARRMGQTAYRRVAADFQPETVWTAKLDLYRAIAAGRRPGLLGRAVKRAIDVAGAAFLLLATAPLLAMAALAVRLRLGSPVLFRQTRPGLDERPFTVRKLRTMNDARDAEGRLLPDEERLTALGRFLRRWSIDELPQLWNVVRGEMSLVGPRPLLAEYLAHYDERQRRRHLMRPGVTGWAQIHGRNRLGWEQRFELDVWYVENWNLALDLRILSATFGYVLRGAGVEADGAPTPAPFRAAPGSRPPVSLWSER